MEKAYDDLEIDQFEKGFTDIGGLKARYMTSRKKDRAIILDDYIKSYAKPPQNYGFEMGLKSSLPRAGGTAHRIHFDKVFTSEEHNKGI